MEPFDLSAALFIVRKLRSAGHEAYFAGGWVRDFLLGHPSADVDIATSALPEEVQQLFDKTLAIGAQFGVILVVIEGTPVEVTTFRKESDYQDHRHPSHIEYASVREDAERRDFTVNGMYYDPIQEKILDFVEGRKDLEQRCLRAIGNPAERFEEDRLRLLRGVRFAVTLGFEIEKETAAALREKGSHGFAGVSPERIAQEFQKMHQKGRLHPALLKMEELGLLEQLFPDRELPLPPALDADLPMALHLCSLFRHEGSARWVQLAEELRLSGDERRMVETLAIGWELLKNPSLNRVAWAHYLARPWAEESLTALYSGGWEGIVQEESKIHALSENLEPHVHRLQMRTPLVTATDLMKAGLQPGPELGIRMKEAEALAITEDLQEASSVLSLMGMESPSSKENQLPEHKEW